jgi:hypothetical protein
MGVEGAAAPAVAPNAETTTKVDANAPNRGIVVRTARARVGDMSLPVAPIVNFGMNPATRGTREPESGSTVRQRRDQVVLMAS